uniref:Glycine rich superfamily member n=1 Tax=Rhipicephalus appendiculatus TaxID=34631 RepID=A0A131YGF3_RHIAP
MGLSCALSVALTTLLFLLAITQQDGWSCAHAMQRRSRSPSPVAINNSTTPGPVVGFGPGGPNRRFPRGRLNWRWYTGLYRGFNHG